MSDKLYQQVYEALRHRIETGEIAIGGKLPSQQELTEEFGVSGITIRRSLDMLSSDGFIVRRPRIGTVVVADRASAAPSAASTSASRPLFGCVLTNFDDVFGTHVLTGILDAAEPMADVIVKRSLGSADCEERMVSELIEAHCDGIILLPTSSDAIAPIVLHLAAERFPLVIMDRALDAVPVSTVCSDNFEGGRLATEHLFSLGHTKLGLVLPRVSVSTIDDRRRGFVYAHAAAHVPYRKDHEFDRVYSVVPGQAGSRDEDLGRLTEFLRSNPSLTGFVVSEFKLAELLLEAAATVGRRCPRDISVVCFDHPPTDRAGAFTFAHIRQDQAGIGQTTIRQLVRQHTDHSVAKHVLPITLVPGDSCAPLPESPTPATPPQTASRRSNR